MGVTRTISIDAEVESVGQYDRVEKWHGKILVSFLEDGRIRIGDTTVGLDDLRLAMFAVIPRS